MPDAIRILVMAVGFVLGPLAVVVYLRSRGLPWRRDDYSQRWFDWWSATHIMHGLLFCFPVYMLCPTWGTVAKIAAVLIVEEAWELFENSRPGVYFCQVVFSEARYRGDSVVNSIGDILSCLAGALLVVLAMYVSK